MVHANAPLCEGTKFIKGGLGQEAGFDHRVRGLSWTCLCISNWIRHIVVRFVVCHGHNGRARIEVVYVR